MKIAIFTDSFLPGTGGTENAVLQIAKAHVQNGNSVLVCAPKYWDYVDNFEFEVTRCKSSKVTSNYFNAKPNSSKDFIQKIDDFAPDVIHCHTNGNMLVFANKYSKKHKIPLVTTIHTKFSMTIQNDVHSRLITKIACLAIGGRLKHSDEVCAVSNDMRGEFDKYGYKKPFHMIKNGTPENPNGYQDITEIAKQKYYLKPTDNVLLYVGHIAKFKNVNFTFEALKILNKEFSNFKMIFVGMIDDKKFVKKVEKSELRDKVIFTGNILDKNLLKSLYQNAKLFLFPSIFDNDSLAIIESASNRTPSVVIQGTGSSERIVDGENGFIIENSPKAMATKILHLLNNPKEIETVGLNAEKQLNKKWTQTAKEYQAVYDLAIEKHKNKW